MNRQRPPVPATCCGPFIDAELTAIRAAADPGKPGRPDIRRWPLRRGDRGGQIAASAVASKAPTTPADALAQVDAVCASLNRVLLAIAVLLGVMVLALDRHPDWRDLSLQHPGWFGRAFDHERGSYPGHPAADAPF